MLGFQMQKKGLLGARRDKNSFHYSTSALFYEPLFFMVTEAHLLLESSWKEQLRSFSAPLVH